MAMMAVWQGLQGDSISGVNTRLLMIFVGVVAVSMAAQAMVLIAAGIAARKTQIRILEIAEELRGRANPILDNAEVLIKETLPKIRTISDNLVEASEVIKSKAKELDSTLTEVNAKTKIQVARVDGMITTALTAAGALGAMVHQGIKTPLVEALGVVNGFKAGLDVLLSKSRGFANSASVRNKTAIALYQDDRTGM
jgi:hypothetical protein